MEMEVEREEPAASEADEAAKLLHDHLVAAAENLSKAANDIRAIINNDWELALPESKYREWMTFIGAIYARLRRAVRELKLPDHVFDKAREALFAAEYAVTRMVASLPVAPIDGAARLDYETKARRINWDEAEKAARKVDSTLYFEYEVSTWNNFYERLETLEKAVLSLEKALKAAGDGVKRHPAWRLARELAERLKKEVDELVYDSIVVGYPTRDRVTDAASRLDKLAAASGQGGTDEKTMAELDEVAKALERELAYCELQEYFAGLGRLSELVLRMDSSLEAGREVGEEEWRLAFALTERLERTFRYLRVNGLVHEGAGEAVFWLREWRLAVVARKKRKLYQRSA